MSENDGRFKKGNQAALKHGGAGAYKAIQLGLPFEGLAEKVEQVICDELETQGQISIMKRNAARFQTTSELYWSAVQKAVNEGDLVQLHGLTKTWGWLTTLAQRAWTQLQEVESEGETELLIMQSLGSAGRENSDGD